MSETFETEIDLPVKIEYYIDYDNSVGISGVYFFGCLIPPEMDLKFMEEYGRDKLNKLCLEHHKRQAEQRKEDLEINEYELRNYEE